MKNKTSKQLERYSKGVAHWRRVEILALIGRRPGLSLEDISNVFKWNIKTTSAHTHRLAQAGLLRKLRAGMMVEHHLSPYGKKYLQFLHTFK